MKERGRKKGEESHGCYTKRVNAPRGNKGRLLAFIDLIVGALNCGG